MDAFFASVEQRDDPRLRGKPVIVGGHASRGVVLAASYEVRRFGVHSALPMAVALRRAPDAIVVSPRRESYLDASSEVFKIFRDFSPEVEALSIDEAFIDVTASRSLFGSAREIATMIRSRIREELDLPASAGIAPSKFVAKIASDVAKPDGLLEVLPSRVRTFLDPLPVGRMWGVSAESAQRLESRGLRTLGDLARASDERIRRVIGPRGFAWRELARGNDPRRVHPERTPKSIGSESTFERDLVERESVTAQFLAHAERIAERLFAAGFVAGAVTVKLKYADFAVATRTAKLAWPASDALSLFEAACTTWPRLDLRSGVRLVGLSAGALAPRGEQPLLIETDAHAQRGRVQTAVSAIRDRFGRAAVSPATLVRGANGVQKQSRASSEPEHER